MAVYSNIIEMLDAHGIVHKRARGDEIRIGCLYHGTDNSMHMYINTTHALFLCHRCGEKGNAKRLAKELGDIWDGGAQESHGVSGESFFSKLDIYNDAAQWYKDQLNPEHYSYKYLVEKRGLTKETIEKAGIGYAPNGGGLFGYLRLRGYDRDDIVSSGLVNDGGGDFFRDKIVIPYFASGFCVQLRGKDINGKYFTPPDQDARLYGLDEVKEAEEVIVTEGEFDALSLRQLGFSAVACPGAGLFKEEWAGWFENYRRIYICFDSDEAGKQGAERTHQILGRRTRKVELPEGVDVNDLLVAGSTYDDFLELLRTSAGRRLRRLGDVRKTWEQLKTMEEGIYMGLDPRIDAMLKPGFQRGQFIVLLAKTGAGKSISMLNIAYHNKHVPQILVSLEQTSEEMYERMRRISLFFHPAMTEEEIEEEWKNILITDENKLTSREFEDLIFEYEEEMGRRPHLVWIDYLGYFARSYKGEEYQRLSDAVMDLKSMAKKNKVVIFSPHQVNRTGQDGRPLGADNARGSGVIEETGDFVFALWRPNEAEQNAGTQPGEVAVRILKSRHGGKGSQFTMIQAPQSLAYVPHDGGPLEQQAMAEFAMMEKKLLFDDIHELRRARLFTGGTHMTLTN